MSGDKLVGSVMVGIDHQLICVPSDSPITVLGIISKLADIKMHIMKIAAHNDLLVGIVVNETYVTPKVRQVLVILMSTT